MGISSSYFGKILGKGGGGFTFPPPSPPALTIVGFGDEMRGM